MSPSFERQKTIHPSHREATTFPRMRVLDDTEYVIGCQNYPCPGTIRKVSSYYDKRVKSLVKLQKV
jgi:hypothetical protein